MENIISKKYKNIYSLIISINDEILFVGSDWLEDFIVIDWKECKKYDEIEWINYSKNWSVLVFKARKDNKIVNLEEKYFYDYIEDFSLKISFDWKSVAFLVEDKNGDIFLLKDWKIISDYDFIDSYLYSPNWEEFVFSWGKWNKMYLNKNWINSKWYDKIYDLTYCKDSKSFSYGVRKNNKWFIIKDWKISKEYCYAASPTYSQDWKSFSFRASKNWKSFIVKDWIELKKYIWICSLVYSPDSKYLAYISDYWTNRIIFVVDWKESEEYELINLPENNFNIFRAKKDNKMILVVDWKKIEKYDLISRFFLIKNKLVFNAEIWTKHFIVDNSVESKEYEYIYWLEKSEDSLEYSFIYKKNGKYFVNKNWIISSEYDYIDYLKYLKKSNKLIFIATKNNEKFIVEMV